MRSGADSDYLGAEPDVPRPDPTLFDLPLPPFRLEGGARLPRLHLRGFLWGPSADDISSLSKIAAILPERGPEDVGEVAESRDGPALDALHARGAAAAERRGALSADVPTALVVHALTADPRVGGPGGWWSPIVGPGEPLDPDRTRVLCFNNLGSCYGSFGPADAGFPSLADEPDVAPFEGKGAFAVDPRQPATVTTWDQARAILLALDALGIERVDLVVGGSVGGMITLCLAALAPERFARVVPIAACARSTSWIRAWNHIARQAILSDPGYPEAPDRGLELARQIAHVTYRAEASLAAHDAPYRAPWAGRDPLRVQTYLEHQGAKLRRRFIASAYLTQLSAMDHHDLERAPGPPEPFERWTSAGPWGVARLRSATFAIGVDSDQLFLPGHGEALVRALRDGGVPADGALIHSPHGHDAFLLEWDQLRAALTRAWAMSPTREA